jgi:hypothetical protein
MKTIKKLDTMLRLMDKTDWTLDLRTRKTTK